MTTGQKNFIAVALFVTLFAALLLAAGCTSTLLKSTVDYRALQVTQKALSDYDAQLSSKIESELSRSLENKVSMAVKNEVGNIVLQVLPWGLSTAAGGGLLAALAKKKGLKFPNGNGNT